MTVIWQKGKAVYQSKGVWWFIFSVFRFTFFLAYNPIRNRFLHHLYKTFRRPFLKNFFFHGLSHEYFYHSYNFTWCNERIVEVPIIMRFIEEAGNKRILEVGNVLSHYVAHDHDVVDKYERSSMVINQDIAHFRSKKPYDLIVSISTLEHVGWDESDSRNPEKVIKAFDNIADQLCPNGNIVVTMPLGYNPDLDEIIDKKRLPFTQQYFLKRVSKQNEWQEVGYEEVRGARYDYPFHAANAIVIGIFKKGI